MKAAMITKAGEIGVREVDPPILQDPHQVLVRVKMTGICGSDVHIFQGENPFATYPRIFGHEFAGEVAAVGAAVTRVQCGDHVVGEPIVSCSTCYACRSGRPNVCEALGVMGVHIEGGCQEYLLLDESKAHKIAPAVPWRCAVLAEPLTIGLQATSRGDVRPGDVVLIMGSGTIGLCTLLAAKARGAVCIITDLVAEKLQYAKKLGADHTVDVSREDLARRVREIAGDMGPNVILDCVGSKASLEQAVEMVSVAGRVVELGFGPVASEVRHVTVMKKEVGLMGTRLQTGKFPGAVKLVEENTALLEDFVTQAYPVERVGEAFAFALDHPEQVRKIVIEL